MTAPCASRSDLAADGALDALALHVSAGALVCRIRRGAVECLLLHRRRSGTWDLSKGTVEPGDHLWWTALREVREETGYHVRLNRYLGSIWSHYRRNGRRVVKRTHYFIATPYPGRPARMDHEHDARRWVRLDEAVDLLAQGHRGQREDEAGLLRYYRAEVEAHAGRWEALDIGWIQCDPILAPARLGLMSFPTLGALDLLAKEADAVLSLCDEGDLDPRSLATLHHGLRERGLDLVYLPIPDNRVPTNHLLAVRRVQEATGRLRRGQRVVIHCLKGHGRSGLMAACILVALGVEAGEAIARVRGARPGALRLDEQVRWVEAFRALHDRMRGARRA